MQVDNSPELPEIATLEAQIQLLNDVYNRIQSIRQIPPILIRLPKAGDELGVGQQVRAEFQQVKNLGDSIRSAAVQAALDRARKSLLSDNTELVPSPLREYRKQRCVRQYWSYDEAIRLSHFCTDAPLLLRSLPDRTLISKNLH